MIESRTIGLLNQLIPSKKIEHKEWASIPGNVLITADEDMLKFANAQYALFLAVNSISRLFPVITKINVLTADTVSSLEVPLFAGKTIRDAIQFFSMKLNSKCLIEIVDDQHCEWDVSLSIGRSKIDKNPSISIGSDGWIAYISTDDFETKVTSKVNPIGAYTAASIGGMEVFKYIFYKKANILAVKKDEFDVRWRLKFLDGHMSFSTFSYEIEEDNYENPELPCEIDVGKLFIIGLGAGGGATSYTLASLPLLTGNITLVDPDEITPSNMNRYIYSLNEDSILRKKKVDVIHGILKEKFNVLDIKKISKSYQDYIKEQKIEKMDLVVSTVDTKKSKMDIQWDMPRVILDAAVVQTEFYLRRVDLGSSLCIICSHQSDPEERSPEELASEIIGIPVEEIVKLRSENAPLELKHIEAMKKASKTYGFILPAAGERFGDWWLLHCGEIVIAKTQERLPLPFATILPGILIAGEIIKERYFPQRVLRNHLIYDMVALPSQRRIIEIKPKSNCIFCSNPTTLNLFKDEYGKTL